MTNPFANAFQEQEEVESSPFAKAFEQQSEQEQNPFVQSFTEQEQSKQQQQSPGFFQGLIDKLTPKPFTGKLEYITDEELNKLEDPEQRKNLSIQEKRDLMEKMNTQREFEQGLAASKNLTFGLARAAQPDAEFKLLDEKAQNVYEGVGTLISFASAIGPANQATSFVLPRVAPFLTRMIAAGSTAGLQEFGNEFFDPDREVSPVEVAKEFGKMALLDGALQGAGLAYEFGKDVYRIGKVFDVGPGKAFKFVWDEAGKRGMGVRDFAKDARKWADLAEDLAMSAEDGRITLEVPDAKIGGKPIAEIEGPTVEVNPIESGRPQVDPSSSIAENIESLERDLLRSQESIQALESQPPVSEKPVPTSSDLSAIGNPSITSPNEIDPSLGFQEPASNTSIVSDPSSLSTILANSPVDTLTGPTLTVGIPHPSYPNRTLRQTKTDVKDILDLAQRYKPNLDETLNNIKDSIQGISKVQSRVKDLPGALKKAEVKGAPETLGDYLGGRIVVDSAHAFEEVNKAIGDNFRVIEFDNFLGGRPDGYRAVHYQVDTGDGLSVEIQVMPKEILDVFDVNHKIYDKWKRETDRLSPEQVMERKKDFATMKQNFDDAWAKFESRQKPLKVSDSTENKAERSKQKAFQQFRQNQLSKKLADLKSRDIRTEEPQGLSQEAATDIVDPDPTDFTPEQQSTFNNSETDGYFQTALLKDGFAQELDNAWNKLGFNVERPFQNIGAPETGFQIKNYYSSLSKKEEQTLEAIRNIGNFDPASRSQIALLAEQATPPDDPALRKAYDVVRNFFDETFKELQDAGILKDPFPDTYVKRLQDENALARQRIQDKVGKKSDHEQLIKQNNELIKELKNTKFVSIPAKLWFEKNFDVNRPVTQRTIQILNQKKRSSPTIRSLIDNGLVAPEDVDIAEIMAYYGRRAARDIGLGKILKAAESEGLASLKPKPGFVQLPVWQYPAIKDYHIHPKFAEFLSTYANPKQVGLFGRLSSKVKGLTFYNPVILPFNDVVQQIMATQGTGIKYWAKGMRDVVKKTPEYWEAYENGLFSQPYNMFQDDFQRQWTRSLSENKTLPQRFKQVFLEDKVINAAYNASSSIAWAADRVIRMATYRNLLERGMDPRQAAQTAALFHGDYSMVSPNTRKTMNQLFFTPTFKVVMGKLYSEMLKSPVRIGKAMMAGEEVSITDKAKFFGLLGTLGTIIALDQLMTNGFGFQRDQFGRKYKKTVEDDEGVDKDLTVNFSNPATLPLKFFWRTVESFSPSNQTALKSLIEKNKFELNPVLQIAAKLVNNQDSQGDPIYENYGDDSLTKFAKASIFTTKEVMPFLKQIADEPFEDPEARQQFFEEVGLIFDSIPGAFVYWGQSDEQRRVNKIKQANTELMRKAKRLAEKGESISEEDIQKYQKLIERMSEEKF